MKSIPEQTPQLNEALAKFQAKLPKLERDGSVTVTPKNADPYSYTWATLPNLSETVLPLLGEFGLSFSAMPGLGSDGKLCLQYSLLHSSGEERSGEFPLSGEGGIQQLGGRITYARRYCLQAVTGVAAEEDSEARLAEEASQTAQRNTPAKSSSSAGKPSATAQRSAAPPPLPGQAPAAQEAAPAGPLITAQQLAKMHATFGDIGWTDDSDKRRAASTLIGRPLTSGKHITLDEARKLLDTLDGIAKQPDPSKRLTQLLEEIRGESQ